MSTLEPSGPRSSVNEFLAALDRLPPFDDVVFRGWRDTDVWSSGAGSFVTSGITPTSRDPRVASENFTTTGIYAITCQTGRAIENLSRHPHEREVVLRPVTVLVWGGRVRVGDVIVTLIDEVLLSEPKEDGARATLLEIKQRIAARVATPRRETMWSSFNRASSPVPSSSGV